MMNDPGKDIVQKLVNKYSNTRNTAAPSLINNSINAQQYEGLPVNRDTLQDGTLSDLAYTTEGYWSQLGKNFGRALVNTAGFAASTAMAIPNIIDNTFNDGNDRLIKPLNEYQDSALKDIKTHLNPNEKEFSSSYFLPSWISGNTQSFWGDVIEQSGIIAGTTLGMGAVTAALRAVPGISALSGVTSGIVKNTLTGIVKPATLLAEEFGMSKNIINTLNSQKFVNGLSNAAKLQGINAVQSYTEALFEGLDGERNFTEAKIEEYKNEFGEEPKGKILDEIKKEAENLKESRFKLNMVGLMISNTPFTKAFFGKSAPTFLERLDNLGKTLTGAGEIASKKTFKNLPKYLDIPLNAAAKVPLVFSEGFEEVYQLAVEKGLDNYYTNKINTEDFEANFDNISKAMGVGISEGVFSKEGLKSFILGAGVGSIFQGIGSIKDHRALNKYLDEQVVTDYEKDDKGNNDVTKPIYKSNRELLKQDVSDINRATDNFFNNSTALNQTLAEKVQQFVTENNNAVESLKLEGSFLEYDQNKRSKFDSIYPYVAKGYTEFIQSKVDGIYEQFKKENPNATEEEKSEMADKHFKSSQDIKTIEKFTKDIDGLFSETFKNPAEQFIHKKLKDISAYHLWNMNSLSEQRDFLKTNIGSTLYEASKSFNGINYKQEVKKQLEKYPEGIEAYNEKRAELNKISSAQDYLDYLQKDREGLKLSVKDFLNFKAQNKVLKNRVKTNNDVILNLVNVKSNPVESFKFLNKYFQEAEKITYKNKKIEEESDLKNIKNNIINNALSDKTEKEKKEIIDNLNTDTPTALDIKIAEEEIKKGKEEKKEDNITPIFKVFNNVISKLKNKDDIASPAISILFQQSDYVQEYLQNTVTNQEQGDKVNAYYQNVLNLFTSPKLELLLLDSTKLLDEKLRQGIEYHEALAEQFKELLSFTNPDYKYVEENIQQQQQQQSGENNKTHNDIVNKLKVFIKESKKAISNKDSYEINGKFYKRVSRVINEEGLKFRSAQNVTDIKNSLTVGNYIDIVGREIFKNSDISFKDVDDIFKEEKKDEYIYYTKLHNEKTFNEFKKHIIEIKNVLLKKHTVNDVLPTIISDEVLIKFNTNKIKNFDGIAGTTDIIIVDSNGDYFIYDFKNKTENKNKVDYNSIEKSYDGDSNAVKWSKQQSLYSVMLNDFFGKHPKSINAIVVPVTYEKESFLNDFTSEKNTDSFKPTPFNLVKTNTNIFVYGLEYIIDPDIEDLFKINVIKKKKIITITPESSAASKTIQDFEMNDDFVPVETNTESINIDEKLIYSVIKPKEAKKSRLKYDNALLRNSNHEGSNEIYNIKQDGKFLFSLQNNKQNFLIDLNLVRNYADQHTEIYPELKFFVDNLPLQDEMPFVSFLEELHLGEDRIDSQENDKVFKQLQEKSVTITEDVDFYSAPVGEDIFVAEKGSLLHLFNFPKETLYDLLVRLDTENKLYSDIQNKGINEVIKDIPSKLEMTYLDSYPIVLEEAISLSESNHIPDSMVFIQKVDGNYEVRGEYADPNTEKGNTNNNKLMSFLNTYPNIEFGGYYVHFKTDSDSKIYIRNILSSGSFEDLNDKTNFRISVNNTNDKGHSVNKYYNVQKVNDIYEVTGAGNTTSKKYNDVDSIITEITKNKPNNTISFFESEKNLNIFEHLYNKGTIKVKSVKNTRVSVKPGVTKKSTEEPLPIEPKAPVRPDVNEVISFNFPIRGGEIIIEKINDFTDGNQYHLNENVTYDMIQDAIKLGGKNKNSIKDYLFTKSGLFSPYINGTPSHSSILEDQLNKIKEFIEEC